MRLLLLLLLLNSQPEQAERGVGVVPVRVFTAHMQMSHWVWCQWECSRRTCKCLTGCGASESVHGAHANVSLGVVPVRVFTAHMQMSHWVWCQWECSRRTCKCLTGWQDKGCVPSHQQHRYGWIFCALSLYTGHQTCRLRLGGMRSHAPFIFFLFFCVFFFFSWTKSVSHKLGVRALRLQFCIHLWVSDCAYLGKQSLFMNRVNTFWMRLTTPILLLSGTTAPFH